MLRPPARLRSLSNLLASPLERLLGREDECADAIARFREGARLVTLTGPGGGGKSSVAREVGRRLAQGLAGKDTSDVLLCELADATGPEALVGAISRAASFRAPPSSARGKRAVETLAGRLATMAPLTLVLDDVDGVVAPAASFVRACLDADEGLRFLVTSREALGLEGERVQAIGPLGAAAALELFESHAGAGGATWTSAQVATLVEHLDGLPLGIELAARRSRLVPPGDLLDRLEERLRLLRSNRRDGAARHASLPLTIDWSLARLDPDEARAFAALGVFDGSFTVDAFEAVVGPLLHGDSLDAAEALMRKSLVASAPSQGAARLSMLRTLRAFARERLEAFEPGEHEATERRHAMFYVARAEEAAAQAYGPGAETALDGLEAELPNLLRAFEKEKTRRPDLAARLMVALGDVVVFRNAFDLRSPIFAEARAAADRSGDAALRVRTRIIDAKVRLEVAGAADAEASLVEALAIADGEKLEDDGADVRRSLAWARIAMGQAESALELIEQALVTHRAARSVRGEADALAARGLTRCLRGEVPAGHSDLANAYALHVMSGDAIRREKVLEMAAVVGLDLAPEKEEADAAGGRESGSAEERMVRLRNEAEAYRASGRVWREAVARFQLAALEAANANANPVAWVVGPEARWVRQGDGAPVDLARHGALRRVLDALVTRRIAEPGAATTAVGLLESGWPDEKVRHESGMLRVYSVVRRLRALGFGDALVTRDDGYLIDPRVRIERAA
jgi:predicted ATPase